MPLFSVIIPVYNTRKYLQECINSVLKQKYQNFEIILINDNSTDGSKEICKSYSNSKKFKIIPELLSQISLKKDCYFSRMSGSGSVCYGLFNKERAAKKALNIIKTKYPKFWVINAKTV